jgi:hypothetical protein
LDKIEDKVEDVAAGRGMMALVLTTPEMRDHVLYTPRLASRSDVPDVLLLRVDEVSPTSALHRDLAATDPLAEDERLVALGARPVDIGADGSALTRKANGITWFVLTDLEGNECCIGRRTLISRAAVTTRPTWGADAPFCAHQGAISGREYAPRVLSALVIDSPGAVHLVFDPVSATKPSGTPDRSERRTPCPN